MMMKSKFIYAYLIMICISIYKTSSSTPNIILFLTDDQDLLLDGLRPMQKTLKLIANRGVFFENAFVNSPICCPSRSSILTGKHAHNTMVFNNSIEGNCSSTYWQQNFEKRNIAALMKHAMNYTTLYAGKYLNQYGNKNSGGVEHVPPGFDWWLGLKGNSRYYNYTLSVNGSGREFQNEYLTDQIRNYSSQFLKLNHDKPFFMILAPPACHAPFTGADRHLKRFPNARAVRNEAFNYSSTKKHWIVSMGREFLPSNVSRLDDIQRKRLQTLLAVDEMVEGLIEELKQLRIHDNTYLIFTSDNGYHVGQFGQPWDKRQPYESDIRIPFMISGPGVPFKKIISYPISAVDIAPTILDLANISVPNDMDGRSFKKDLKKQRHFDKFILIEYWGEGNKKSNDNSCPWKNNQLSECREISWCKCQDSKNNTYSCVLRISKEENFKFCRFSDNLEFKEAYNLNTDPHELNNIYKEMNVSMLEFYEGILDHLKKCRGKNCHSFRKLLYER